MRASIFHCEADQFGKTLGVIPERWGRMDLLSRAVLVATGDVLRSQNLLADTHHTIEDLSIGLICSSMRGSLASDILFGKSMVEDASLASPALFCYTLATVPLAEAAIHYRLTGPVFALIGDNPYAEAIDTAGRWLRSSASLYGVVAGAVECSAELKGQTITTNLTFLHRDTPSKT
jgi:hypothetical protein